MKQIVYRPVASLHEAALNSRTHSEQQVKQIAKSMETFGWTMPVLIDEGATLIAGHARVRAAKMLGIEEAPCLIAEGWSEEKKTAYQIADNRLSENSDWDEEILRAQIGTLNAADFALDVLGFPQFKLDSFLAPMDDGLFSLPTDDDGEDDTPEGFQKAKEPSHTQEGYAQFSVVVPVAAKKKINATLRKIISAGEAATYSEALILAVEAADGQYS